ncbi:PaaI family thioesterase [Prosthecodimorpha staleyi]|uniref:PaaI family thioesterase n=1 Tax=Prosthecodimorpha staleyi TaxID=2840188 RepID=A0A947GK24_9HYPH|nr:PaaI family thioesterase [Prosthecodimorpha staleyi]MBT9292954.1 PaaI family thioesterase [Prosthecodimorpha staleyi]
MSQPTSESDFDPSEHGWEIVQQDGYEALVGPFWTCHDQGALRVALKTRTEHRNRNGAVHGGVILSLADQGLGLAVLEATGGLKQATIQLDLHFVAATRPGQFVVCIPKVDRVTSGVAFVRGELKVGDRLVATAEGIWKYVEARR